jgi:quinol monooxygenase YgiN
MCRLATALLACALLSSPLNGQSQSEATAGAFYAVSYVEVAGSATAQAVAALKQYREASRSRDGFVALELFEQSGRRGHFAIIETWRDQKGFDGREPVVQERLREALQPIRVSGYDQRPYKTLTVAPVGSRASGRAVYVITHVDVTPDPRVATMLKQLAEASRREEGNLRFDVLQHTIRANHFTVVEMWRNDQALEAHVAAPHTKQYRNELQPFTGSPLDERVYKAIE